MGAISTRAWELISPATTTRPVVASDSHATREEGSWASMASSTASEIWSQSLSGWPMETDSEVKSERAAISRFLTGCGGREGRGSATWLQSPRARDHLHFRGVGRGLRRRAPRPHRPRGCAGGYLAPQPARAARARSGRSPIPRPAPPSPPSESARRSTRSARPGGHAVRGRCAPRTRARTPVRSSLTFGQDLACHGDVSLAIVLDERGQLLEGLLLGERRELD